MTINILTLCVMITIALGLRQPSSPLLANKRNSRESVIIYNNSTEISTANIILVLELKNRREEITLEDVDSFPSSGKKYSRSVLQTVRRSADIISATIDQVQKSDALVKAGFINPENGWNENNVVLFIPTKQRYRVVTSLTEIEKLVHGFAYFEFDEKTLGFVDELLSNARKENTNLRKLHETRVSDERINRALGTLEAEIRRLGAEEKGAILSNDWSPKLSHALSNPQIRNIIENSENPEVKDSFEYLLENEIIKLK